jgi:hypothetical protein
MSYMVDKSPAEDKLIYSGVRPWEPTEHKPVLTASRSAYKPYSTYVEWPSTCGLYDFTNTEQSQEQVHTVAAQVRTPVEPSCINSQDALTGAQTTPKALGDLLCNVNIVWFRLHTHPPAKLAVSTSSFVELLCHEAVARYLTGCYFHFSRDQHASTPAFIKTSCVNLPLLSHQL